MSFPKYHDTVESTQYLKSTLLMLGNHKLQPNIINLHIFFEYVSEGNKELKKHIDELIVAKKQLTPEDMIGLYENFIWDDEKRKNAQLADMLREHFASFNTSVRELKDTTTSSQNSLQNHSTKLEKIVELKDIDVVVDHIISETKGILQINKDFEQTLERKQSELEELKRELLETKEQVDTDPLTKLKNRRFFETTISNEMYLSRHKADSLSLIYLDIDHFKKVNDTYGHLIGDRVICFVAATMQSIIGESGVVARMGGEEFAILLPKTNMATASTFAESIRNKIEVTNLKAKNSLSETEVTIKVTISIGITTYKSGEKVAPFLERADKMLYKSKETGRNKITTSE